MGIIEILLISIGLSFDVFVVHICVGAGFSRKHGKDTLLSSLIFGGMQLFALILGNVVADILKPDRKMNETISTAASGWELLSVLIFIGLGIYMICKARNNKQIFERRNDENLDAAANLTGELLAELFVFKKDVYERDLREMGFYLGKFIYLCDCFEDIEQDIKKKNYNPLIARSSRADFEQESRQMLEDMMARACRAFECLPLIDDAPIMRNILYSGIWLRFESAAEKRKAKGKQ